MEPLHNTGTASETAASSRPVGSSRNLLDIVLLLRAAGPALVDQAALHGQLIRVGWAEEKARLLSMLTLLWLGAVGLICMLLGTGALVLALAWDTPYRIPAVLTWILACAIGSGIVWRRLQGMVARGSHSFEASFAELAADVALLRSQL